MRGRKNSALRDVRSLSQKKLTLMVQRDRADARAKALKETLELLEKDKEDLVLQAGQSKIQTRTEGHGRPYTDEFEAHAVKCMSTGISAQQCREQVLLNGAFHKAAAAGESGGQARLEKSGTELLRSIFKLIHSGWRAYEKVGLSVVSQSPCCSLSVVGCSSSVVGYRCRMPRALIFVLPENGGIGNNAPRAIRARIPKWAGSATTNRGCEHQAQAPKRSVNCDFFYLCMHTKAHFFLFSAFCSLRRATTTSFVTTSGK